MGPCQHATGTVGEPRAIAVTHPSSPSRCFLRWGRVRADLLVPTLTEPLAGLQKMSPALPGPVPPGPSECPRHPSQSWGPIGAAQLGRKGAEHATGPQIERVWGRIGNKAAIRIVASSDVFASSAACTGSAFLSTHFPFGPWCALEEQFGSCFRAR